MRISCLIHIEIDEQVILYVLKLLSYTHLDRKDIPS